MTDALPSPDEVRRAARGMAEVAAALEESAAALGNLTTGRWRGPAAEAAQQRLALFDHPLRDSAQVLAQVAGALAVHAGVLDEAVLSLRRASAIEADWRTEHADDVSVPSRLDLPVDPPADVPAYEPHAGPGLALAAQLRTMADGMIAASAARTAAVLADAAAAAPTMVPFHPRDLDLTATAERLQSSSAAPVRWYGAAVGYVARDPESVLERNKAFTDAHGGEGAGDALDVIGVLPLGPVSTAADIGSLELASATGDTEEVVFGTIGLVPVVGDAVKLAHDAGRIGRGAARGAADAASLARLVDGGHKAYKVLDKGADAASENDHQAALARVEGLVGGGHAHDTVTSRLVGPTGRDGASTGVLPSETLAWRLLSDPAATWRPVQGTYERHPWLLGEEPRRWTGRTRIEQGGRLVTYAFAVDRTGGLVGRPQAVGSRPLPPERAATARAADRADADLIDQGR